MQIQPVYIHVLIHKERVSLDRIMNLAHIHRTVNWHVACASLSPHRINAHHRLTSSAINTGDGEKRRGRDEDIKNTGAMAWENCPMVIDQAQCPSQVDNRVTMPFEFMLPK